MYFTTFFLNLTNIGLALKYINCGFLKNRFFVHAPFFNL